MDAILAQLITPEIQEAFKLVIMLIGVLYVLTIVWVVRDAFMRGTMWYFWGLIALIPFLGAIAYSLLRPPLLELDRNEQELEIALKRRQLQKYGECANCSYPVESDYIICPQCHQKLKSLCWNCGKPVESHWSLCPFCASSTKDGSGNAAGARANNAGARAGRSSGSASKRSVASASNNGARLDSGLDVLGATTVVGRRSARGAVGAGAGAGAGAGSGANGGAGADTSKTSTTNMETQLAKRNVNVNLLAKSSDRD